MGINTRNVKLLAFAMGASFGGIAGAVFSRRSSSSARRASGFRVGDRAVDGRAGRHGQHTRRHPRSGHVDVAARVLRSTMEPLQNALFGRVLSMRRWCGYWSSASPPSRSCCSAGRIVALRRPQVSASSRSQRRPKRAPPGRPNEPPHAARRQRHLQALRRRAGAGKRFLRDQPRRDLRADRRTAPARRRRSTC